MEIPEINEEIYWQYAVISRPKKVFRTEPKQVAKEIVNAIRSQLGLYIIASDITYRRPNFIIYLNNSHPQRQVVAASPIRTRNFQIQIVPWSREHELTQLPWITDGLKICIDPLTILPVPSQSTIQPGTKALKDSYASMISGGYELKAPDYSYLMISELRDFYYEKFDIFKACKHKTIQVQQQLQDCLDQYLNQGTTICNAIQATANSTMDDRYRYLSDFAGHLNRAATHAYINHSIIGGHINLVQAQPHQPMNLNGFNKIPPFHEVPVPSTYVTRLRVIHAAVSKAVYKAQSIITTVETAAGQFEAFMTRQSLIQKYNDLPQTTPASIETLAIYYSLKQITNVLGYQIVDLNHPTLAELIASINNLSVHMSLLQCCVSYVREDINQIYETFNHLYNEYDMASDEINDITYIHDAMKRLDDTMTAYHSHIISSSDDFTYSKIQFLRTYLHTESPNAIPGRWLPADKPVTAADPR
ncbi:uncharacterized protein LOC110431324 isoform X3 [Sorghum bicolor]|uniref:uncharacterized protein LOC110431324 isoform X3 n=1 Tax=Sorghum bicolor TaxID=4558 RepID=UPI000B4268CE|nr:uncharacterized protein LOC110431324 isoform X3 [Sorghum bicolor]|eukprot:XP_021306014.1 uncharacterized protein LOC110431324 isoform X3 [Sorghum bicolor]